MTTEREQAKVRVLGKTYTRRDVLKVSLTAGAGALALSAFGGRFDAQGVEAAGEGNLRTGAIYTMTDEVANRVVAYYRAPDGTLTEAGRFPTGGLGSGRGNLFGQGAIVLSGNEPGARVAVGANHLLFVCNYQSNEISVFRIEPNALVPVSKTSSGGIGLLSLAVYQDLLYALHQNSGTISGFRLDAHGALTPIPGSTRTVSGGAASNPAQVEFSKDGAILVATERETGIIDTYLVDKRTGLLTGPRVNRSNSREPFGCAFDNRNNLFVAEGNFVVPAAGAVSSFRVLDDGTLQTVSPSVFSGGTDTCWIVITDNGRYAYVQSFGDSRISSYTIAHDGTLVLLQSAAAFTGLGPGGFDLALTLGSQYLYGLNGQGTISGFAPQPDGTLAPVGSVGGLPPSTVGIAAR